MAGMSSSSLQRFFKMANNSGTRKSLMKDIILVELEWRWSDMAFNLLSTSIWYVALRLTFDSPDFSAFGSLLCQTIVGVLLPLLIKKFKELLTWIIICKVITMCHKSSFHKSNQSVDCLPGIWFIKVGGWSLNAELRVKA